MQSKLLECRSRSAEERVNRFKTVKRAINGAIN